MKKIIILLLFLTLVNNLYASNIDDLANSDEWHNLLLDDAYGKGFVTDDSKMFACGERDYKKEINYLINNQNPELYNLYPARYECINRNLGMDIPYLENNTELQQYLDSHDYDTLSIALSEPINDQLMSTFGHAIVILNNKDENIGDGVSINLFAHTDNIGSLDLIKRGLTGDLIGYFDFDVAWKIFENYAVKMQRELVVFDTTLTKVQIKRILLMVWELQHAPLDYQFIKRNCVNGAVSILDYAVGNLALRDQANTILLPYSLVKVLKLNNLINDITTYSAADNQIGLELDRSVVDDFDIRKTYWSKDAWEIKGMVRTVAPYYPHPDESYRPYYINNNLSYIGVQTNYKPNSPSPLSYNLEYRLLNADTWERVFSSPRNVKMIVGKIDLYYNSINDFGLNEFILWQQSTYNKYKFYNHKISSGLKIALDNDFNDKKLKPYVSIQKGISFGLSSLIDIPYDPLLIYFMGDVDIIFDYLSGNLGLNAGLLYKNTKFMINLDAYYSIANLPYNPSSIKSNRFDLISMYRINDRFVFGAKYDILENEVSASLRYYYSPWGF
ncbi:MAG: DUF4105 domain-containing protein [Pleomorphochaeta sp.]